jgi:hypothetical protein
MPVGRFEFPCVEDAAASQRVNASASSLMVKARDFSASSVSFAAIGLLAFHFLFEPGDGQAEANAFAAFQGRNGCKRIAYPV